MKLTLRPATSSDAPILTDIYFFAFSEDDISLLCFPRNSPVVYNFWYNSIIDEIKDPNNHFLCVVDDDASIPNISSNSTPHIVAYAKWVCPVAPVATDLPTWPIEGDTAFADHFFGNLLSHNSIMRERKHWYLELGDKAGAS